MSERLYYALVYVLDVIEGFARTVRGTMKGEWDWAHDPPCLCGCNHTMSGRPLSKREREVRDDIRTSVKEMANG